MIAACVAASSVFVWSCVTVSPVAAQTAVAPAPATAAVNPKSAGVAAASARVLRETSEIRKLAVLRTVKSGAQSRAEVERMLLHNLDEDTTPAEFRASELTLKKLGLVPADFNLRPFLLALLTEQVAGYYDPKAQQFYLADWIGLDEQEPVMAHELTHALQDQHFNLRRFENWPKGDADAQLAAHALVEGDATLLMTFYVMRDVARAGALMKAAQANGGSMEKIDSAPRVLRESLIFPYLQGTSWVSQLYKRGGWPLVSEAYTKLPQSTEQILHADKYFAGEGPVKVELSDASAVLGVGWKRIDYDVNGEWGTYLMLDEFLKSEKGSQKAAAGWGGDRYALYEQAHTGHTLLTLMTAWDTEQDAREFLDAYRERTKRRYKLKTASTPDTTGAATSPTSTDTYQTGEGAVVIARRGQRVLILEGVPSGADAKKLVAALLSA